MSEFAIGLPDVDVVDVIEKDNSVLIKVVPKNFNRQCRSCSSWHSYSKGNRSRFFRDVQYFGKQAEIEVIDKRRECLDCGATYDTGILESFSDEAQMTKRLIESIQTECFDDTFVNIAAKYSISESNVRRIFNNYYTRLEESWVVKAPRILGIDEAHLADDMRAVFIDVESHTLIEMAENRKKQTVKDAILAMRGIGDIEVATMDMSGSYRSCIEELFGDRVAICVDKFHLVERINQALTKAYRIIRRDIENRLESINDRDERRKAIQHFHDMRMTMDLFRKNKEDLDNTKRARLNAAMHLDDRLAKIWTIKETLRDILNSDITGDEAADLLRTWYTTIPDSPEFEDFRTARQSFISWEKEICNYFDYHATNAVTEAVNGVIKEVNKRGRGYSYNVLKAKIKYRIIAPQKPVYVRPSSNATSFVVHIRIDPDTGMTIVDDSVLQSGSGVDVFALRSMLKETGEWDP